MPPKDGTTFPLESQKAKDDVAKFDQYKDDKDGWEQKVMGGSTAQEYRRFDIPDLEQEIEEIATEQCGFTPSGKAMVQDTIFFVNRPVLIVEAGQEKVVYRSEGAVHMTFAFYAFGS